MARNHLNKFAHQFGKNLQKNPWQCGCLCMRQGFIGLWFLGVLSSCIRTSGEFPYWLIAEESTSASGHGESEEMTSNSSGHSSTEGGIESSVGTGSPELCGNGIVDDGEECDDNNDNNNDACLNDCIAARCGDGYVWEGDASDEECDDGNKVESDECLNNCVKASCGDGKIWAEVETCDDEDENGKYDKCNETCDGYGERCGDGIVQQGFEDCDSGAPKDGCLPNCNFARSCQSILAAYKAKELTPPPSTSYYIHRPNAAPGNNPFPVYCEMTEDRGYTFLKMDREDEMLILKAPAQEEACAEYGMQLMIIRNPEHADFAYEVAMDDKILPLGGGKPADHLYLRTLAIYPEFPQSNDPVQSCTGKPFKFDPKNPDDPNACKYWYASDHGPYWISDEGIMDEPGINPIDKCTGCSLNYYWANYPAISYFAVDTAWSYRFMCDVPYEE